MMELHKRHATSLRAAGSHAYLIRIHRRTPLPGSGGARVETTTAHLMLRVITDVATKV
jgi:hypothetical protein